MPDLRVATFNLQNLALPGQEFYPNAVYSATSYDRKVRWTARQLGRMNPHVIGFQECFSEQAMQAVLDHPDADLDGARLCVGGGAPAVALAVRAGVEVVEWQSIDAIPVEARIAGGPAAFKHPVIRARLGWDGVELVVYVVHLKSKRPDIERLTDDPAMDTARGEARSLVRRAAEACGLRWLLLRDLREDGLGVCVLGDLNDSGTSVTTGILAGPSPHFGRGDTREYLRSAERLLAKRATRNVFYTHIFDGQYESLDHVLVSHELVFANPERIASVDYVQVYNDHLVDTSLDRGREVPEWKSDHAQLVVTLRR